MFSTQDMIRHINDMTGQIVMHFKGDMYLVIGLAERSDDTYDVAYKALYGECKLHTRPMSEFFDVVEGREDNYENNKFRFQPCNMTQRSLVRKQASQEVAHENK
ncbi:MAG: DUF1653 domain-containing protein [Paraclostridium sp.]